MYKTELRKKYLQARKELSESERIAWSHQIMQNFILQFNPFENQLIHCFLPIFKQKEIDTGSLIQYCFKKRIRVFVPKVVDDELISVELKENTELIENNWGILEPNGSEDAGKIYDFVIVPLLYCDNKGNRVGYGKGYYDKLLCSAGVNTRKIGVSFFSPLEEVEDVTPEDIPMDYLITPFQVFSFKERS